jgi:hypothetical protein
MAKLAAKKGNIAIKEKVVLSLEELKVQEMRMLLREVASINEHQKKEAKAVGHIDQLQLPKSKDVNRDTFFLVIELKANVSEMGFWIDKILPEPEEENVVIKYFTNESFNQHRSLISRGIFYFCQN